MEPELVGEWNEPFKNLNLLSSDYIPAMDYMDTDRRALKNKLMNFSVSYGLLTPQGAMSDFVRILYLFDDRNQTFRVFDVQLNWSCENARVIDDIDFTQHPIYYHLDPSTIFINWQNGFPNIKY